MVEIGASDFHHISQPPAIQKNKPFSPAGFYSEPIINCEECAAAKICKKIGTYRKSCEPGKPATPSEQSVAKCIAGTNILLAKLLERMGG
jgi:hypothetical protein